MSDLVGKREAYLAWIAAEGSHQKSTPDTVDAYVAALEASLAESAAETEQLRRECEAHKAFHRFAVTEHDAARSLPRTALATTRLTVEGQQ